jgi:membrane-associated protein
MALIEPLMTSPALYPVVAGFAAFDVLFPVIPSEGAVIAAGVCSPPRRACRTSRW